MTSIGVLIKSRFMRMHADVFRRGPPIASPSKIIIDSSSEMANEIRSTRARILFSLKLASIISISIEDLGYCSPENVN